MRYFIAGGAGFIGSNLARYFKRVDMDADVLVVDNLYRRGSEMNVQILKEEGINFEWCDVRDRHALSEIFYRFSQKTSSTSVDVVIDCVAEPAVKAGTDGKDSTFFNLVDTNLNGTINLLWSIVSAEEKLYSHSMGVSHRPPLFIFLSTSRVYSINYLNSQNRDIEVSRLESIDSPRSYYGTTKLAAELFVEEMCKVNQIPFLINRCGIIAGPGQFGKVDQGVISLWAMAKHFGKTLSYNGFGGKGDQTRDALHIDDLCNAIRLQINKYRIEGIKDRLLNIGGGIHNSFTLKELTAMVHSAAYTQFPPSEAEHLPPKFVIDGNADTDKFDIFSYVTDNSEFRSVYGWQGPQKSIWDIIVDTLRWIKQNEEKLKTLI